MAFGQRSNSYLFTSTNLGQSAFLAFSHRSAMADTSLTPATGSNTSQQLSLTAQESALLNLPPEIRNHVYRYALIEDYPTALPHDRLFERGNPRRGERNRILSPRNSILSSRHRILSYGSYGGKLQNGLLWIFRMLILEQCMHHCL